MPLTYKRLQNPTDPSITVAFISTTGICVTNDPEGVALASLLADGATILDADPPVPAVTMPAPLLTKQTTFDEVEVDATTTSKSFIDLLSRTLTSAGGTLLISASFSASNSAAGKSVDFHVLVDDVVKRGSRVAGSSDKGGGGSIVLRVPGLLAGSHTIKVQWKVNGGTAQIRPVTQPEEHASLLIQEIG